MNKTIISEKYLGTRDAWYFKRMTILPIQSVPAAAWIVIIDSS